MAAFQFHNRKLIINAVNETIEKVCTEYCDPTKNSDGRCPIACISICHPTCLRSFWPQIPPPTLPYLHTGSNDNRTKHHDSSASLFLTFPLATLAVALFLLCFYAIYRWWHGRPGRRSHPQDGGDDDDQEGMGTHNHFLDEDQEPVVDNPIWYIRTVGLQPSIISAITVVKYKRGDGLVDQTGCAVCLSEFQEDDTLRLLPKCNHAFHLPCIDTWLRSHTNCPMCRAAIAIATNSTAGGLPLLGQSVENYGPLQGSYQVEIRENNGEFRGDTEDEARELRAGTEGEDETGFDSRITKTSESSMAEASDSKSNNQPMRRSVSVDIVWDSITSLAVANVNQLEQSVGHLSSRLVKGEELKVGTDRKRVNANQSLSRHVDCSLIGRSVQNQKAPISMKRSYSCSGKVLSSRYSTSRDNRASPSSNF